MYKTLMMVFLLVLLPAFSGAAPPAALPQTGQTQCYDPAGAVIVCAGTGQDGEQLAGVAWPVPRFINHPDNTATVIDQLTGLIWSQDSDPAGATMNWQAALDYIKTLNSQNFSGHNDWRLPNLPELRSLLNYQEVPSTWLNNQAVFASPKAGYYWSSTTSAGKLDAAWLVNLGTSLVDNVANKFFGGRVWPVRGDGTGGLIGLSKSGQTGCWNDIGVSVSCAGTGQDGELQNGATWPEPRFSDLGDQTIKDNLTGLIWTKDAFPAATEMDWQGALTAIKGLNLNQHLGHDNWRLPNPLELASLVNLQQADSTTWLNSQGFSNVMADYWTATTDITQPTFAWRAKVSDAAIESIAKSDKFNTVWPVRTDLEPPVVTASPAGGKHQKPLTITLTANEPATIYYTTSGADPTTQSTVYSAPLSVNLDTVLKFFGVDSLGNTSGVTTENYIIVPLTTATPPGGTYSSSQSVTLTSNEPATIYYTTSGANPTIQSAVYSGPISITSDTVLKFFGVNSLGNAEDIRTESYIILLNPPVNGDCGSADKGIFTSIPTTNLCAAGTPSVVSGSGPWTWTCTGVNGGTNDSCTADIATYQISFSATTGGSISGTLNQTVKHGGTTTEVTAVPASGYHFVNWTGTGGFVATISNPLTVGPVTAAMTITANFAADPLPVTITTKALTKPLGYKGAKKKLSFTAGSVTLEQIVQSVSTSDWITIVPESIKFAKGKGSLTFTVAANQTTETLTGEVRIGSAPFTVSQAPTPCVIKGVTVMVNGLPKTPVPKAGGTLEMSVDVFPDTCKWTVATAKVSPCAKGTDPSVCLEGWFDSSANTFPDIGEILTGDKTFTGTVAATEKARTLSGKVVITNPPAGKGSKSFSIKQLAK